MLLKRVLAALVLAAIGLPAIIIGNTPFFIVITLLLVLAAWEYTHLFRAAGFFPSPILTVGGVFLLVAARRFAPDLSAMVLAILSLAAMTWHLVAFERGRDQAATDFSITIGGIIYLGWIGAYFIDLRALPDGLWYLLLSLGSVWVADSAAYFIGSRFGRHKLSPRLSPKKTWEGYWGGVFFGTLGGAGLTLLWPVLGGLTIPWWQGGLLGLVLSLLTTLGDLGESMIKRQANSKDSSNLIPGHGGFLDRIDSWIWAAVLGYYFIVWFIQ